MIFTRWSIELLIKDEKRSAFGGGLGAYRILLYQAVVRTLTQMCQGHLVDGAYAWPVYPYPFTGPATCIP